MEDLGMDKPYMSGGLSNGYCTHDIAAVILKYEAEDDEPYHALPSCNYEDLRPDSSVLPLHNV